MKVTRHAAEHITHVVFGGAATLAPTNMRPVSTVVKCLRPPPVANAEPPQPLRDSYNFGGALLYRCLEGFTLNGRSDISCSDTGRFTPDPPTCISTFSILVFSKRIWTS